MLHTVRSKNPELPELRPDSDERSRDLKMEVAVLSDCNCEKISNILKTIHEALQLRQVWNLNKSLHTKEQT